MNFASENDMQMQVMFHHLVNVYLDSWIIFHDWMNDFRTVSISGDLSLRFGFVYLTPCWVVMLSVRYMYKLSEPGENHRSCRRFPSRTASASTTDTTNECKLRFCFCVFMPFTSSEIPVCSSETDTFVMCERLHISSGRWVSEVNSPERCFCEEQNWTLNSPLHFTQLLNEFNWAIK